MGACFVKKRAYQGLGEELLHIVRSHRVEIPDTKAVSDYLALYPELSDVVRIAVVFARSRFPQANLALKVYQDPEIDDLHLALYVRTENYSVEFLVEIEHIEKELEPYLSRTKGWLILTTDFLGVKK